MRTPPRRACGLLPPEGAVSGFGRPGAAETPPRRACGLPPPEGAVSGFGRPGAAETPPRHACGLLPPPGLRIALVVDRYGQRYGGAEAYGVALARELSRRHEVTVVAREVDPAETPALPAVVLDFPPAMPSWLRVRSFARQARAATREGYDIVHSHMNGDCGDVEVAHVTPVRYNWRVRPLPWLKRWLSRLSPRVHTYLGLEARRFAERRGHRSVAVSPLIAAQLRAAYGEARQFAVIPPGVAPAAAGDLAMRAAVRSQLGLGADDLLCLLVARNPLRKGLPTVLGALARLPARYHLAVVGDVELAQPAARRAPALAGRLHLIDATAQVGPYYAAADICVHATLNDSFGMVPLEAMAHGVAVVLSPMPWCGFADYVQGERDALLLDHPEDVEGLARALRRLGEEPGLRRRLSQAGLALARRHGWPAVAARYEALYADILRERATGAC